MPITITPAEAADALARLGHTACDIVPLSGGLWSAAFAFAEDGREYVVRFHDRRDDLEKDRFAYRWASDALRTPRIVEVGSFRLGGYGISERVHGQEIDSLDEAALRRVLPSLLRALDGTRSADLSGTRGYGLWHGDGHGEFGSWHDALLGIARGRDDMAERRALLAATDIGTEAFDAGLAAMRELLPLATEERHLAHNDLLYHNVLADQRGVVLLDWGASIYGDFLYDAALLIFWWPYFRQWSGIDVEAEILRHYADLGLEIPHLAERLRCCELHIGIDHIAFQAGHGRLDDARWTARHTHELARMPL